MIAIRLGAIGRGLTTLILTLQLGACSMGSGKRSPSPEEMALKALGDHVNLEWKHDDRVISYCPDNTCLRFIAPGSKGLRPLLDFTYLYFYEVARDPGLEPFRTKVQGEEIARVVETHLGECGEAPVENPDGPLIRCVLRGLRSEYEIRAEELRFDTSGSFASAIDLDETLR